MLRRPPFARLAAMHLSAPGASPYASLMVIAGPRAWDEGKAWDGRAVILPPGEMPELFDWSVVTASPCHHAFVIDTGEQADTLQRLGRALIHAGALHVAINSRAHGFAVLKVKGAAHAA